jgi:adenylate kinase family enzyme
MRRVVILGPAGSGKSTLASLIAERTALPVIHMDLLFWRPGWTPAPREEALRDLETVIRRDEWILEGNFIENGLRDDRFVRADTVIFLDFPRRTCFWRLFLRLARDRDRSRSDLPQGCAEGFDLDLLRWVWAYPKIDRPRVLAILARLDRAEVHHLHSRVEVERFLAALS